MLLTDQGLLRRVPDSGTYRLGLRLFQMGRLATIDIDLGSALAPMRELAQLTGERVSLGVQDDCEAVVLQRVESPHPLQAAPDLDRRFTCWTAMGRALLAWERESEINRVIRHGLPAFQGAPTPEEFRVMLAQTRQLGYAVRARGRRDDIRAVAAPVRDAHGNVIAVLSVGGPSQRLTNAQVPTVASMVIRTASVLSGQVRA